MNANQNPDSAAQIVRLQERIASLEKTNAALIRRVERSVDTAGDAFSTFETNILLQARVNERTEELKRVNEELREQVSIRLEAQTALQNTLDRMSSLIKASPLAITLLNSECRITLWNEFASKMFGWSEQEVLDQEHPGVLPRYYSRFENLVSEVFAGKEITNAEGLMRTKDGRTIEVIYSCSPVGRYANETKEIVLVCADVTERNKIRRDLDGTNQLLTSLMGDLSGMVYRCRNDVCRTMEFLSDGCLSLTGRETSDLIENKKLSYASIIHPDDADVIAQELQAALESESSFSITYRIVLPSGEEKWVWEQGRGASDWSEGKTTIEGLILDVTEKRKEEERRARLATAVEQAAESIVVTSTDGTIEFVNPAFEATTGYSSAEAIGQNSRILKSDKHERKFYQEMWGTILRGEVWQGKLINKRKDGSYIEEETTISPVRNSKGAVINFVALKRDVTKLIELETQLLQAQKLEAVGSLAAGIAHEINTPIQFVGDNINFLSDVFMDLLRVAERTRDIAGALETDGAWSDKFEPVRRALAAVDTEYLSQEIPAAIDQTLEGVERVATIVRAMKNFSHPDKGEKSTADINQALQTTLVIARNEYKLVADVETEFAENLPPVPCYPGALNQVFLNLFLNAAHAIADANLAQDRLRGTITVQTKRENDQVVVSIRDTGTGISAANRQKVFDPFFTTKAVGKGTGQGLAIARSIVVDKHGGALTFDTEEGKGTVFFIRLPLAIEEVSHEANLIR